MKYHYEVFTSCNDETQTIACFNTLKNAVKYMKNNKSYKIDRWYGSIKDSTFTPLDNFKEKRMK